MIGCAPNWAQHSMLLTDNQSLSVARNAGVLG